MTKIPAKVNYNDQPHLDMILSVNIECSDSMLTHETKKVLNINIIPVQHLHVGVITVNM